MPRKRREAVEYPKTSAKTGWCLAIGREHHKKCPHKLFNNTCPCDCHKETTWKKTTSSQQMS
jgi:hypothetical protein